MAQSPDGRITATIKISGIVQGVGFRPFIQRQARQHGLAGFVKNESGHIEIRAQGTEKGIRDFVRAVVDRPPVGARLDSVEFETLEADTPEVYWSAAGDDFIIAASGHSDFRKAVITPDIAMCEDCLRELFTPGDPRYLNPFISCVSCGPRFSIIDTLPYDRDNTTMDDFKMCTLCAHQFEDPGDRRCHAQTICCNSCGPALRYVGRGGAAPGDDAAVRAAAALKKGGIVAVKGIGGYHFACSPDDETAVRKLRELKGREDKPFAVMFRRLEDILTHCKADDFEKELLLSPARPIVLLKRKPGDFAQSVCRTSRFLGAMLPYTPLQHLLLMETGPLVMTSANVSSLPIIIDDGVMQRFFDKEPLLDGVLTHNRRILRRLDDSVAAVVDNKVQFIRRARGYVPLPIEINALQGCLPILACGAQQKSTVCLTAGPLSYLSTELGALDSMESIGVYRETIRDLEALFHLEPSVIACDMHPGYASTEFARDAGLPVIEVQHHFAHIASVMAEHNINERVIGVAFDGTGYGTDGTVWGGEFLLAAPEGYSRAGHLKTVRMLGSDDAVMQGWKTAACFLWDAGMGEPLQSDRDRLVRAALENEVNTIRSSSMGRLFDAVSALLGICEESTYEGQGAIELENAAAAYESTDAEEIAPLPFEIIQDADGFIADLAPCLRVLCTEKAKGVSDKLLALRFHLTVVRLIADMCTLIREITGITTVCLSGGVFQNRLLVEKTTPVLASAGFEVFRNEKVPPNDGGIALGQAFAACRSIQITNGE